MHRIPIHLISLSLSAAFFAGSECAFAQRSNSIFRTIDGTGNNLTRPDWGKAGALLLRHTAIGYSDGVSQPAGSNRPSARAVSNAVVAQTGSIPNRYRASSFLWQWGQFLDHDIDLTEAAEPHEEFPIAVPRGDLWFDPNATGRMQIPLNRSAYAMVRRGRRNVREQRNDITAYIDASNVYGSDETRARALRGVGGLLATSAGDLLPFNTSRLANAPSNAPNFFLAGDIRANEQVGLIAMHTLFVREHNRLARLFAPLGLPDDMLFELVRAIVGAEMQAITYREFLPVLLGRNALRPYRGYRSDVDAGISNAFSTAAYRLGHSMLPTELLRLDARNAPIQAGPLLLRNAFFAPSEVAQHGIDPLLRGLVLQPAQEIDSMVIDGVRNFLFGEPGQGGFDLASLNIQRGRDHGLASYNQARVDYGLSRLRTFRDLRTDPSTRARLQSVYRSVDDVDLWIGGLAEQHVDGAMVGPLFHRILSRQFERLRDGDRYWYRAVLPPEIVAYVEFMTLARIIRANTSIGNEIPDDVFRLPRRR